MKKYLEFYKQLPLNIKGLAFVLIIAAALAVPISNKFDTIGLVIILSFLVIISILMSWITLKSLKEVQNPELVDGTIGNVKDVESRMNKIISDEINKTGSVEILNYGLDMETVVQWIDYQLVNKPNIDSIIYKGLIVDIESTALRKLIDGDSNIKTHYAKHAILKMKELISKPECNKKDIDLKLRSYSAPPVMHGFMINKKHLFLGFTEIKNHKLYGGGFPYQYYKFQKSSDSNVHCFQVFNSWFDYTWKNAKEVI